MTENRLLDAVDALTKPFVLARYTGVGHDHEWRPVTRPLTPEEVAERKAAKKPIPRKVETGEYWCQWCDQVVTEKPADDVESRINRHDDAPLLDQLHAAITSNIGGNGVGKLAHTRTPFDVGALNLYGAIDERVRAWIVELGGKPGKDIPLTQLLRTWYVLRQAGQHPEGEDDRYAGVLAGWRTAILDIIDPPEQVPYRGQPCPLCGETRARIEVAGDVEDTVALWAFFRPEYREEGSYGLCRACRRVLAEDTSPIRLRAKMNGAISSRKRLTHNLDEMGESIA